MKIEQTLITPAMAAELLEQNTSNRRAVESHIEGLAGALKRGEWLFNGDAIRIGSNNALLDGQHRLMACVRSGVSFESVIIRDIAPGAFKTIDTGRRRGGSDVLSILGKVNATNLAAALRVLMLFEEGRLGQNLSKTNTQILDALSRFHGIEECVSFVSSHKSLKALFSPAVLSAGFYICLQFSSLLAKEFFGLMVSGAGLPEHHPVLTLREYLIKAQLTNVRIDNLKLMLLLLKSFREFLAGRKVRMLRVGEEETERLLMQFALTKERML